MEVHKDIAHDLFTRSGAVRCRRFLVELARGCFIGDLAIGIEVGIMIERKDGSSRTVAAVQLVIEGRHWFLPDEARMLADFFEDEGPRLFSKLSERDVREFIVSLRQSADQADEALAQQRRPN